MKPKNLNDLYKLLADKHNISKYQVEDIFKAQCDLTYTTMADKKDRAIRWPLLGTFGVKKKRREYLNQLNNNNDEEGKPN
jgi:nucleoid DNA-binding protein